MTGANERGRTHRTGFWWLIALLAASGVAMAIIVVFGMFESVAYSIVWRVFVADLYLIASLAAQHRWLRLAAWAGTAVTFVLGMVSVFWRYTPYWEWADGSKSHTVGDSSTGWSPWFGFEDDLEISGHVIVVTFLLLGFVSFAYRWISAERLLRGIYVFTFVAGFAASLLGVVQILDSPFRMNLGDWIGQLQAGLVILALTAAAIVIIAAFVQRSASRSRQRKQGAVAARAAAVDAMGARDATGSELSHDELRTLVRGYVDEYLRELAERQNGESK